MVYTVLCVVKRHEHFALATDRQWNNYGACFQKQITEGSGFQSEISRAWPGKC